ncbi:MAG: RHS repeat-associated core domain-containing protein [Rhodanobacter sp.]
MNKQACRLLTMLALWLLAAGVHAGTVTYVYTDLQGTPLMETDAHGNITARFEYTPYGAPVTSVGAAPDGPGYTGHVNDPETGLVYMQARYYDAGVGHMLSVDPVRPTPGNVFSFNRYAYANNNPIINTDPDGRCPDGNMPGGCGAIAESAAQHPDQMKPLVPYAMAGLGVMAAVPVVMTTVAAAPEVAGGAALADVPASATAINAATDAATAAQVAGATQGATTGLVTESGEVFTGASANAGGPGVATNPVVQKVLDSLSPALRSCFHGGCGEVNAASNALNAGAKVEGGVMATVRTIGNEIMETCPTCAQLADRLGIKAVSP